MTTEQAPIDSGFGPETTAEDVMRGRDLSGVTAIVTGGYSGIGTETTRVLAQAGAHVIVPARDLQKARGNLAGIRNVELASLDLMEPGSIDSFARDFVDSGQPLGMLINSAGIMASPLMRDNRGYEAQFSTNHLGHFQLALRLWPALVKAEGARVVAVSSRGHRFAGVDFDDPNFERRDYDKWLAYGQSKTANALFAMELDRRGKEAGIRAFSVHPGAIVTDLSRYLEESDLQRLGVVRKDDGTFEQVGASPIPFKTVPQGAATQVWCAVSEQLDGKGGVYCEDCDIAVAADPDKLEALDFAGVAPWAHDAEAAARLWTLSETLTGAKLTA
jgi:NAD(P)-dependent dehydrogenase (short-subunit alcohol dehydrogenase family)